MSTDTRVRSPRGRRGVIAFLVAVAGIAVSAFGAVEAVSLAKDHRTIGFTTATIRNYGARTELGSEPVLTVGLVTAVLGLLLLLCAAVPPRRPLIELTEANPLVASGLSAASLRRALSAGATRIDGISSARARIRGHRIRIEVNTGLRDVTGLADQVHRRATDTLAQLEPSRPFTVRVKLKRKAS